MNLSEHPLYHTWENMRGRCNNHWVKQVFILIIFVMLTGCTEIRYAKANDLRQATKRADDKHDLRMNDSRALTPVRLAVKEVLLWSLMVGGVAVIISMVGAISYSLVGAAVNFVRDKRIQQIPLDVATRQYPLLLYGNGRRVFNPNTGERLLLSDVSEADLLRIEAATRVQLAGLITDNSKVVNGELIR